MLKRLHSLDEDANEDESDSDTEDDNEDYSDDDENSIDEELLLDKEAMQRVERLRNEVATAVQNIRNLRAQIPRRSLELSKREMDMLLEDKEALLHVAELQKGSSDVPVQVLSNLTNSIPVDGMQEPVSKLSKAIICERELSDKLESVQRTVDSVEIAMKTKASDVDLAMMMNEEEETFWLKQAVEHQSLSAYDILSHHVERE